MAIILNDNLSIQAPKSADSRYGPYTDTATAISSVIAANRYQGLVVGISGSGSVVEYWWKDGTADAQLVLKVESSTSNTAISAASYANGAFVTANSAASFANAAFGQANSAASFANSAFTTANNALPKSGGIITGALNVASDLTVTGNLTVLGQQTTINTSSIILNDPLLFLANNNYTSDAVDIGIVGHYNDGANAHTGIFRDPNLKEYIFFKGYTPEVTSNNLINIADPSFAYANVYANTFKGNVIAGTIYLNGYNTLNYINSAFNQANSAASFANGAFGQANSAASFANSSFIVANSAAAFANGAFVTANSAASFANGAFVTANAGFGQANSAASFANSSFIVANSAAIFANASYSSQNITASFANAAYAAANSAAAFANAAFTKANTGGSGSSSGYLANSVIFANTTGYLSNTNNLQFFTSNNTVVVPNLTLTTGAGGQITFADGTTQSTAASGAATDAFARNVANSAASFANGAFVTANSAASFANGSFVTANSAASFANGAFGQANSAASFANGAFITANAAFGQANSSAAFANGAFGQANSAASFANGAFTQANSEPKGTSAGVFANAAFTTANSGASFANAAFITANSSAIFANASYSSQNITASFANAAYLAANSAAAFANAAFTKANTGGSATSSGYLANSVIFANTTGYLSNVSSLQFFTSNNTVVVPSLTLTNAGGGQITFADGTTQATAASGAATDQVARNLANSAGIFANAAFVTANSAASFANGAFTQANAATTSAATASGIGSSAASFANAAFTTANSSASFANGAFVTANAAFGQANSAASFANSSFIVANSAASFANSAFLTANSAASFANGAFGQANSAASFANGAFTQANNAASFANSAFTLANNEPKGVSSGIFANAAFLVANSAASFANGAFTKANTDVTSVSVTAGSYGSSSYVPVITVEANGRISSITTQAVTGGGGGTLGPGYVTINTDSFTATGSSASFTLSATPPSSNNVIVNLNGVPQLKSSYTVGGTTLTLSETPVSGTKIDVMIFLNGSLDANVSLAYAQANLAYNVATSAASFANGAFTAANSAGSSATVLAAFDTANSAYNQANAAFDKANTGTTGGSSNSFSTILVSGQPNVIANIANAPLTLVAGSGMTITTVGTSNTITFASTVGFSGGTIADQLISSNTLASTSNTTGAVIITGGVGITGNLYTGNIVLSAANSITFGDGTVQTTAGVLSIVNIIPLDDISELFDGVTTIFSLTSDGFPVTPFAAEQLLISVGGVVVSPFINRIDNVFMPFVGSVGFSKGYVVNDDGTIQFAAPPIPAMDFDGRLLNTTQNQKTTRTYPFTAIAIAYDNY